MRVLLLLLLILPQFTLAGVYLCVDPQTGQKTFTDRACGEKAVGQKLRVDRAQSGSLKHSAANRGQNKSWNSQRDERLDGREYRQRERIRQGSAAVGHERYLGGTY